jgi:putative transposase
MPRALRIQDAGYIHHVVCKGNAGQSLFESPKDFNAYLNFIEESRKQYPIKIYNFVLMNDHIHMLVEPLEEGSLSRFMEYLSKSYAKYFNKARNRFGHVFQGRFKSFIVQEDKYFFPCMRYIDLEPVKRNISKDPSDYLWGAYNFLALGKASKIKLDVHELYKNLGNSIKERQISYRALVLNSQGDDLNLLERKAGILGETDFKNEIKSKN